MNLYLLRHGETDWNRSHRFQGQTDIPLNEAGRDLARITRERMPIVEYDRVYVSPLGRAIETAHILLDGRFPSEEFRIDSRISEICFGDWEGTDIDKAGKDTGHPLYNCLCHPELYNPKSFDPETKAESFQDLIDRASGFLRDEIMPLEGECANIFVVAHGALIRAIVAAAGFLDIEHFWNNHYMNCCLTTIGINQGKTTMVREAEIFYDPNGYVAGWSK